MRHIEDIAFFLKKCRTENLLYTSLLKDVKIKTITNFSG